MCKSKAWDEILGQKIAARKQMIPKGRKNPVTGMTKLYWDEGTTLFTFWLKGSRNWLAVLKWPFWQKIPKNPKTTRCKEKQYSLIIPGKAGEYCYYYLRQDSCKAK